MWGLFVFIEGYLLFLCVALRFIYIHMAKFMLDYFHPLLFDHDGKLYFEFDYLYPIALDLRG